MSTKHDWGNPRYCQVCGKSFKGEPINPSHLHLYGGATHYSKVVGVSQGDRVVVWECPFCKAVCERKEKGKPGGYRLHEVQTVRR